MLLEGWLVVGGSPGCLWSTDWTSLCPCPLTGTQIQGPVHKQIKVQLGLFQKNSCLPKRQESVSKQVLEEEHVLPALERTRSLLRLENIFQHHCDETWGPFSAVGATLVDTACLPERPWQRDLMKHSPGSWNPEEPSSLTAAGEGQLSAKSMQDLGLIALLLGKQSHWGNYGHLKPC